MKINFCRLVITLMVAMPCILKAQSQKPYTLFNPVPRQQLREMETDRPDMTESPYTVDAGHIQYETDLYRLEKEKGETSDQHTHLFNQGNLKIGLLHSTSIQFGFQSFVIEKEKELQTGETRTGRGIGDINIRIKQNILGNDGGNFSLAILPYIKFPTARYTDDSKYEGGVIVPMLIRLPGEWNLGTQVEADRLKDSEEKAMHTELMQSLSISHDIIKHLEGIGETYYRYDFKKHHWSNFLNASAQVDVSKNLKLDAGLNYGLQTDAEKNYFIGTSFRF
ncbi:MAG: transporter [Pedobacter sp.]|uniref:transporter n=1 Tax=Pedobacter sp. TaxID=1411316 RepID=UPI0033938706